MMEDIVRALHKVMTGQDIPIVSGSGAPILGVQGTGAFSGIFVVFGADRIRRGIPAEYYPILALDDGNQSIWGTSAQYGVQITTSVLVPPKQGAIIGWEEREKYKKGILDVIDVVVGALRSNDVLTKQDGSILTSGISGKIDVKRDSSMDSRGAFITNQVATIMATYEAYRKEGV